MEVLAIDEKNITSVKNDFSKFIYTHYTKHEVDACSYYACTI